jgi:putative DNA primase/helicase
VIDVAGLKASVSIVDVIGKYVELRKDGHEYRGLCPFHADRRPSLAVIPKKEMWYCHGACGEGGDAIDFVKKIEACDFKKATELLGAVSERVPLAYPRVMPAANPERKAYAPPQEQSTAPDMRIPPNQTPAHAWKLAKSWTYYGIRREVLFYVARYEWFDADGECWKTYRAWTYGDDGWKCRHWHDPRPLYGLQNLAQAESDTPACLCEGEKAADAAAMLFGTRAVGMTWPGGAPNASKADVSHLKDRKVFIWPDADVAGLRARDDLLARLKDVASEVWCFDVSDCSAGWDAADALEADGWDAARLESWSRDLMPDGKVRLRRHDYGTAPARAGIVPPSAPQPDVTRARQPPREHWDVAASAKNWASCDWRTKLIIVAGKADKDVAIKCMENACTPLMYADEWKGLLAWDELHQCVAATRPTPWGEQPVEWQGHHDTALECWFDRAGLHYGGLLKKAVDLVAHRNPFHPVRDYLNKLTWDGEDRLTSWLTVYAGAGSDALTSFVGKAWMISAVARAMTPGVQVKTCLILFGVQDAGKSELLSRLGSPWYAIQHGSIGGDATKAIEQCSKAWIIEMAELAKVKRADDIESVKAFLATKEDTYRPAYAERVITLPRCCVFAGTSNPKQVFNDPTGNVRFWPVECSGVLKLDQIRDDRDQLWAEAVVRWRAGEKWWIEDNGMKALAAEATDRHSVQDDWLQLIADWLDEPEQRLRRGYSSVYIWMKALGGEAAVKMTRSDSNRIGDCMRKLGFDYGQVTVDKDLADYADGAKQVKGWRKL